MLGWKAHYGRKAEIKNYILALTFPKFKLQRTQDIKFMLLCKINYLKFENKAKYWLYDLSKKSVKGHLTYPGNDTFVVTQVFYNPGQLRD